MNYQKIYNSLVSRAQAEVRRKGGDVYYESHHILPRSMGGSNHILNLVLLTAREHFVAHLLLVKFTAGADQEKMARAMLLMGKNNTSRTWEILREASIKALRENHRNNRAVMVGGVTYASTAEASAKLGFCTATIAKMDSYTILDKRPPKYIPSNRKMVVINGTEYPSMMEACSSFGVSKGILRRWLANPNRVGEPGDKITVNGIPYRSVAHAVRETGMYIREVERVSTLEEATRFTVCKKRTN